MFNALELKRLMNATPFQPFSIVMSHGQSHDVPNHDAAFVTKNFLEIGTELDSDNIPGTVSRCAILHITQIKNLEPA